MEAKEILKRDLIAHPKDYFVRFHGVYGELKNLGFHFQKLYAANYQQWNNGDFRVWRKGSDVTHDLWGNQFPTILSTLIALDINNLPFVPCTYIKGHTRLNLYVNKSTFECTTSDTLFRGEKRKIYDAIQSDNGDTLEAIWQEILISPGDVKVLQDFVGNNWITVEKRTSLI